MRLRPAHGFPVSVPGWTAICHHVRDTRITLVDRLRPEFNRVDHGQLIDVRQRKFLSF
jgi:hypothetical protein